MIDLQQIKILAQLIENLESATENLEKSYADNNAENYNLAKTEFYQIQKKISMITG